MINFTDTTEKGFQQFITHYLVTEQHFIETKSTDFDTEFCINTKQLLAFIAATQADAYAMIQKKGERGFLVRVDEKIKASGVIEVLRKGIKHFDKTIYLFYRKPASNFNSKDAANYAANVFSVTQELKYSLNNNNRLDLTVFINGIPIITCELKNPLSGQTVHNAIRQYQNDRDPKDTLFTFARCMVHFAADTEQVFMCSELKGKASFFIPFNKGLNDGNPLPPFGAGNPVNPNGLRTHYFWEAVLSKASLSTIIDKFAQVIEETNEDTGKKTQKMIFPRYHQLTSVKQLLAHAKQNGIGQRYLIQHSAGSGKSKSIAWLAHSLHGLFDQTGENHLFDSVIVITDRTVLDRQLGDEIKQFATPKSIVAAITNDGGSKTNNLRTAIANKKKVIICTIQTFPHLLKEMEDLGALKFAIIIDEAHSSQSGDTAGKMNAVLADKNDGEEDAEEVTLEDKINKLIEDRKMIKNGSYFAFTATPKNKTLELFGVPRKYTKDGEQKTAFDAFHLYSMKQAIEEEFILDVLQNYTTYQSFYKLIKSVEENPEFDTKKAQMKLKAYVEGHEFAIAEKAKIMIDHFHRDVKHLINGEAKAMIITQSISSAIKYKHAFDAYLKEIKSPYKAIVAFSGSTEYKGNAEKEGEYKGIKFDEVSMNNFETHKNDIPKNFKKKDYRFLIVANKYQTGFDQPLLHTMYVDKKLRAVQAVQSLSRLNRALKPYKKDTFVLDFYNTTKDIKEAFNPYFTSTMLSEETNPNKLNDLLDALEKFDVYNEEVVNNFFEHYSNNADRNILDPIIDSAVQLFKDDLSLEQQIDFKIKVKSFLRTYSYLAKLLDFNNLYWEQLWWYLKYLLPKLFIESDEDLAQGIIESIDMDSYRPSKQDKDMIILDDDSGIVNPIPVGIGGGKEEPELDTLENILKAFNQRFGDIDWADKDKVNEILTQQIPDDMKKDEKLMNAIIYSPDKQNAKESSDIKLEQLMQQYLFTQTEIYRKFSTDLDFKRRYKDFIFDTLSPQGQQPRINP
ncbi:MAG: type I restriction endonuclease [Methylococcales bacterium]|nr:type I restriction endonuclease [Methylococcales bacterium]